MAEYPWPDRPLFVTYFPWPMHNSGYWGGLSKWTSLRSLTRIVRLPGNFNARHVARVDRTEAPEKEFCGSMRFRTLVTLDPRTVTAGPIPFRMADI